MMHDTLSPTMTARARPPHLSQGAPTGGRLVQRTFLIALLLVSGGLLTSGALELFLRHRESVETIGTLQREMAQGAAFKIQQYVQDIERTLRASALAQEIVMSGLTESYKFELLKLLKVAPAVTDAAVTDATGHELFKVSRVRMFLPQELSDHSDSEAFAQARSGRTFFGGVYFVRESEPYMTIAIPIERFAGEIVGVLIAEVNLKYIWEVVARIKVGIAGYAYVVSHEGDLIAHPDISLVLQRRNIQHLSQVQTALAGASDLFIPLPNLAGEKVFAAYAAIPDLGWAVLVERPAAEAYAPLYASMFRTSILLLLGLGMAVLASVLIGRRLVRPLAILRRGAARIGQGDLDHRLHINTGDEFQALAEEFNRMATQLQGSYADLELKVEGRTRELAHSVAELKALGEVSQAVNSTLELQTVLTTIVAHAIRLSEGDGGSIYEFDEAAQEFHLRAAQEFDAPLIQMLSTTPLRLGEGAIGRAVASRGPVQIHDMRREPLYRWPMPDALAQSEFRALLALPLMRESVIIGGLVVLRKTPGAFPTAVVDLLTTFATQSALAIQNARLFREIEEKSQEVEIASKHKSQFLANMSHELRTPLNAILGYTELIRDRIYGDVPDKIQEVLGRVQQSGQHLLSLINDVLDISKMEAGQFELCFEEYELDNVAEAILDAVESLAAEKQLRLLIDIPVELPHGRGDERRIAQVLMNLVGNAIKFTEHGEVRIRITTSGDAFLVAVSDTGPGIAPEQRQTIFEEFQQADSSSTKQKGGTGLGLSIAKHIIEMHGGRIWVESSLGMGSTFWFTLPLHPETKGGYDAQAGFSARGSGG
jgi:signal transduction histidine kinase